MSRLIIRCSTCGAVNEANEIVCHQCGAMIMDLKVEEVSDADYHDLMMNIAGSQEQAEAAAPEPVPSAEPDGFDIALIKAIGECGVKREEVLYVGDSNVDVEFAHNAGVKVCGVSWGFRGADELKKAGADHIVDTARELRDYLYEQA